MECTQVYTKKNIQDVIDEFSQICFHREKMKSFMKPVINSLKAKSHLGDSLYNLVALNCFPLLCCAIKNYVINTILSEYMNKYSYSKSYFQVSSYLRWV